jgi:Mg2+ and Co2+ transporter CorA
VEIERTAVIKLLEKQIREIEAEFAKTTKERRKDVLTMLKEDIKEQKRHLVAIEATLKEKENYLVRMSKDSSFWPDSYRYRRPTIAANIRRYETARTLLKSSKRETVKIDAKLGQLLGLR